MTGEANDKERKGIVTGGSKRQVEERDSDGEKQRTKGGKGQWQGEAKDKERKRIVAGGSKGQGEEGIVTEGSKGQGEEKG